MTNLPCPATTSIVPDEFDLAPQADELPIDYQPSEADLEALAVLNVDSFLPRDLPFADWLAEKSRQTALLGDERHAWLGDRIGELAAQARFLGAQDPATFVDRDEAMVGRNGSAGGRRNYRKPWVGPAIASVTALADHLAATTPELAAILRRDLRTLELAAGGAR
jgi:hypothetical protein